MACYEFRREQLIPASLKEVWEFISSPKNLARITPDEMNFEIISDLPDEMYEGMIIRYKVSPIPPVRVTWVTEITTVSEGSFFIDEQRIGPFAFWHHQHILKETPQGIVMQDIVTYQPPFGFIGALTNKMFIQKRLEKIFEYRTRVVEEIFGTP